MARTTKRTLVNLLEGADASFLENAFNILQRSEPKFEQEIRRKLTLGEKLNPDELKNISRLLADTEQFKNLGRGDIESQFTTVTGKLPTGSALAAKLREQAGQEAGMELPEIEERLETLSGLSGVKEKVAGGIDREKLINSIEQASRPLSPGQLSANRVRPGAEQAADLIIRAGRIPDTPEEWRALEGLYNINVESVIFNNLSAPSVHKFFQDALTRGDFAKFTESPISGLDEDVKRVGDIVQTKKVVAAKEEVLDQFLASLPEEQRVAREEYISSARQSAQRFLQERVAPQAVRSLARRGLAEGPGVGSVLAAEGANLAGAVQKKLLQIHQEDVQFYADASYRVRAAKLASSEADYRSQVDFERQQIRSRQQERFRSREEDIQREFETDLFRREKERDLDTTRSGLQSESELRKSQAEAQTVQTVGQTAGQIVGQTVVNRLEPPSKIG